MLTRGIYLVAVHTGQSGIPHAGTAVGPYHEDELFARHNGANFLRREGDEPEIYQVTTDDLTNAKLKAVAAARKERGLS